MELLGTHELVLSRRRLAADFESIFSLDSYWLAFYRRDSLWARRRWGRVFELDMFFILECFWVYDSIIRMREP